MLVTVIKKVPAVSVKFYQIRIKSSAWLPFKIFWFLIVRQKLTVELKNPTNMQTFPLMSQLWTHMLIVLKSGVEATFQLETVTLWKHCTALWSQVWNWKDSRTISLPCLCTPVIKLSVVPFVKNNLFIWLWLINKMTKEKKN